MRYTCDIYEIPLSVFVEIYTNENNDIEFEGEDKKAACSRLVGDYMEIVGGKQLSAEILNCNERINLAAVIECMKACENMMRLKMYRDVCDILSSLGYGCKETDIAGMATRINALKARAQYDLDKLGSEEKKEESGRPSKRNFINEVVAIGKYNKMHINLKEWTAGAYACLVKQTCNEIEELNRKRK